MALFSQKYVCVVLAQSSANREKDLQGAVSYTITVKPPSPVAEAMCVNVSKAELAPIVYETWPDAVRVNNSHNWDEISKLWPDQALAEGNNINSNNQIVLDLASLFP